MIKALEKVIHDVLKVPPQPESPVGGDGSLRIFRAARGFYHYRLVGWGLKQLSVLIGIFFTLMILSVDWGDEVQTAFLVIEGLAVAFALLLLPVTFLLVSLDFKYRWYMVTDRSLRIREGIGKVQERTMTFSNIQNISIKQGPIQRLFGISDLEVRTAGGGGGSAGGGGQHEGMGDNMHVGYFRGVSNAEEIRDLIMAHLRRLSVSGLGDPDEAKAEAVAISSPVPPLPGAPAGAPVVAPAMPVSGVDATGDAVLIAARGLLNEVRALRVDAVG